MGATMVANDVPVCCNKPCWDNREGKRNPKAPDFKCKTDPEHVVWLPKGGKMGTDKRPDGSPPLPWAAAAPRTNGAAQRQPVSIGALPEIDDLGEPMDPARAFASAPQSAVSQRAHGAADWAVMCEKMRDAMKAGHAICDETFGAGNYTAEDAQKVGVTLWMERMKRGV